MKTFSLLILSSLIVACGDSRSSSSQSTTDNREMIIKGCMRSAGVDVNNPKDVVSPSQLAEIEKCISSLAR